jgi:hypothetical protein
MRNRRQILRAQIRKLSLYSCFTLLLLLGCLSDLGAQTKLKVGIIGDQTFSPDIEKSYQVLAQGVDILSKEGVACVLHTGDLLDSDDTPEKYRVRFAQATSILDKLGKPWHLAAGDHDVNPPSPDFTPDSTDRSREALYRELYREREPRLTHTLNHSFDAKGYHFIALNSQEHLRVDPRWGDVFLNRFTAEQYDWLKRDLAKHRNAKGIIVFIHQPMWYNWSGWIPVHQLLRRYPVLAVVAGHFHYDQDEGELDNIRYIVVGTTGGSVKNASRDAGNVHHVTVMTITGRKVDFRLIPTDGSGPLKITPRADMDRVQAIATSLGDLSCFVKDFPCPKDKQNFICLKDNQLFGNNGQAAKLSLVRVGNAIEVPITVRVELMGNKLSLVSPHYMTGICQQVLADGSCVLAPAKRIESSNTSSVVLDETYSGPLPPLWESGLAIVSGSTVAVGDPVELKVRLSFPSSQGTLFVEGSAKTTITACP